MDTQAKRIMLVKYGEVALRQGNRAFYEKQIMDDIRRRIKDLHTGNIKVIREQGRFLIEDINGDLDNELILPRIQTIFGAIAFCDGIKTVARTMEAFKSIALNFFAPRLQGTSFKVHTKRADKRFPLTSNEISADLGEYLLENIPDSRVDLHNPHTVFRVEIRNNAYFYVDAVAGEGGLPYGSAGKGVLLLSGGIDSPVAGYLAARRGVGLIPVYFHSPPYVSERVTDKVNDLRRALTAYTGEIPLHTIPFTDVQLFLQENVPVEKLTIFLKRAMLYIASAIAAREKAHCLITGDAVGQVASQTLHSIAAVNSAAALPILRPLTAMDKHQIIEIARRIQTFDISIRPFEDCCTLFVAKHPENKPNTQVIERMEARLMEMGLRDLLGKATSTGDIAK
ncbi:MAG: tRNA 4-thiouridine(8) synthase ThiI [Defluviitaleaceae bacterium]|nr:tRNA 4-thiouridine(8) synthase ThiI [Defluviitaleaceae bacterium]MCL2273321.1 tRNA 4-thiouridine(8) synthase ThiI [Defluviitaleaceae bacterium]